MGALILMLVLIMGVIAFPISLTIWFISLNRIKNSTLKRQVESKSTSIAFVIWIIIFFFPVDYGSSGSNYQTWLDIWMIKTALIIFIPSILALIFSSFALKNDIDLEVNSKSSYSSLSAAIAAQQSDSNQDKTSINIEPLQTQKRKVSLILKAVVFFFMAFICLVIFANYSIEKEKPFRNFCDSLNSMHKIDDIKNKAISNGYNVIGDKSFISITMDNSKGKKPACVISDGFARIQKIDQQ